MIMIMIMIGGCILMEMELVSVDLAALHSPTDDSDALIVPAFQVDDTAPRVSLDRFKNVWLYSSPTLQVASIGFFFLETHIMLSAMLDPNALRHRF